MFSWLENPLLKWAVPIPALLAGAPIVWLLFRKTWRELDADALIYRQELAARNETDYRPVVALVIASFILLVQEFFGKSVFFLSQVLPPLRAALAYHPSALVTLRAYEELLGRLWWATFRIGGYLLPLVVWRFSFPRDSILDLGLRTRGFREHAWLYSLFVVVVIPLVWLAARQPDFGSHYPIHHGAGRSWLDFAVWEVAYIGQFFALEVFFRGWWLRACRSLGAAAIFAMVVPYAMIHESKPYFEACGAIMAGTVLGSLSMRTGNIYSGFLVHATIALLMDIRALGRKGELPERLSVFSDRRFVFVGWDAVIAVCWVLALVVVVLRWGPVLRRAWASRHQP